MNSEDVKVLSKPWLIFLSLSSLIIAAFGQPARSPLLAVFAACFGYAIFWRVLLSFKTFKERFWISFSWFFVLQLVQLSWMTAHPFFYIYLPYIFFAALQGVQFGFLSFFVTRTNIASLQKIAGMSAFWVLMEWSRLFFLSGYSWNPAGMALAANLYSLQMASLFGVYGLSFWVMFVNFLLLRCWILWESKNITLSVASLFMLMALTPYIYGAAHLEIHSRKNLNNSEPFTALLVQPSFAVDGMDHIQDRKKLIAYVMEQWRKILLITKKESHQKIDLVVLPEYVVPFGTYTHVFPFDLVQNIFADIFGQESVAKLPELDAHLAQSFRKSQKSHAKETIVFVNNAYWLQSLSNVLGAPVVAGLEDVDDLSFEERNHYSAALYLSPGKVNCKLPERYEKRVLVPLGEYIPFSFCKQLAINYGVNGSFTKGEKAKVFFHPKKPFGVSICYEETFGHVMRENRLDGAELLVNLTNDGWFPSSKLTKQHFDHARLRSIECGIPLIRACNTGITGGFDSLGRVISVLGDAEDEHESLSDSLLLEVPAYTYQTIYSKFGDHLILSFSSIAFLGLLFNRSTKKN